jgi:hypothetical protein
MLFFNQKKGKPTETKKNIAQNPKILDVNLIRGEVRIGFDWNKNILILLVVLLITAAFITEIYFGLDWWVGQEATKAQTLTASISQINSDIKKIQSKADEALVYKAKSVEVSRLLSSHIYWTNFFNWLEKNTLSTVQFDGFSGRTDGVYSLNAKALSYAEASWQVKSFLSDPIVKKAEVLQVNSISSKDKSSGVGVTFPINLELDPAIFKK